MTQWALALLLLTFMMLGTNSYAQAVSTPRTETTLIADVSSITPATPFWALLHIKLKDGWHTYWKNPGDSGTSPILQWTLPSGFTSGDIEYQPPERLPAGPLMDYGYNNDAYYLVRITPPTLVNPNATIIIMLKAQWLVCKDVCVPEKADLSLTLPVTPPNAQAQPSDDAVLIDGLVKKLPTEIRTPVNFDVKDGDVRFGVKLPSPSQGAPKSALFFPVTDGIIANNAQQQFSVDGDMIAFAIKQGENTTLDKGEGWVAVTDANGQQTDYLITLDKSAGTTSLGGKGLYDTASIPQQGAQSMLGELTFVTSVLFALLGGLVLNLMPCVLPILSLKVLSVAKKAESEASHVRAQGLAYTAGVVLSFLLLAAILLALQKVAGQSLGWGFQMQSPVFVAFLSIVMLVVGLNLSGAFELPVLFGNVGGEAIAKDNALGSFLTGVLAVMVATPCSAPFMAPAIGFALTQNVGVVLAVFVALGLGLAAPFLLLSVFPSMAALLPKPGMWMLTLRQFLAFPIYLTVVWLLWVLAGEAGANGTGIAMLGMVGAGFCIFLFQRESSLLRFTGVLLACFTGWGITHAGQFSMQPPSIMKSEGSEPFSLTRLDELRKDHRAVFVDATADWCITCKVNEAVALSKPEVKAAFANQHIVTLVADWTRGDMAITEYLKGFERSGVPIYVYYPANGAPPKVLPQILTPSLVVDAVHE